MRETGGYPVSSNAPMPVEVPPSASLIEQLNTAYTDMERSLNFMRRERDELSSVIRETEQKLADLSGMLKPVNVPGPIHTAGMR